MGIVLTAAYKMVVEPLFHLAKGYINGKRVSKERERHPDSDSGIVPGSENGSTSSRDSSRRSSITSEDSGFGGKEFREDLQTLVHQTNRGNYAYWLDDSDIQHIARVVYRYSQSEHSNNNVYFLAPSHSYGWDEITKAFLQDYKGELKRNPKLIFTSVLHIRRNHWVTLVIKPDAGDKKFRAYYCDSYGNQLPSNVQGIFEKELRQEEWSLEITGSQVKQQTDGHNCGIFALENASKITQMLSESKSFEEIDKELSEYKFDLDGKRREFAEALMKDEEWKKGFPPRTETSPTSGVQRTGSVCNAI